jgi:hypothetical protein
MSLRKAFLLAMALVWSLFLLTFVGCFASGPCNPAVGLGGVLLGATPFWIGFFVLTKNSVAGRVLRGISALWIFVVLYFMSRSAFWSAADFWRALRFEHIGFSLFSVLPPILVFVSALAILQDDLVQLARRVSHPGKTKQVP